MKKSLLLALAFAVVSGYVVAEVATPAVTDETTQAPVAPKAPEVSVPQEDDVLDMDAMLNETEETK